MIMKRGFTLVELLAVIGLMGLMAAMAIGGYSAVVRGMSDRAALDAAKGLADSALQRASLDRKKTYVYLFDEVIKVDSEMSPGVVTGLAIAVRPVGRITAVAEDLFCDEFGDLNNTYAALDSEEGSSQSEMEANASTMRLYSIAQKDFAVVQEGVFRYGPQMNATLETATTGSGSGSSGSSSSQSGTEGAEEKWVNEKFYFYGFKKVGGGATFDVGQEYGQEFAVTRLPPGYTFSQSVQMNSAANLGQHKVSVIDISPTDGAAPAITVYRRRPDGVFESIGTTTQVKDGE
jgi:prepilin-type N-terminal cleavage/methylation domain-containing protein